MEQTGSVAASATDNIALFRGEDPTPRPLTDDEVRQTLSIMPSGNL